MYLSFYLFLAAAYALQSFLSAEPVLKSLPLKRRQTTSEDRRAKVDFLQMHAASSSESSEPAAEQTQLRSKLAMTNYYNTEYVGSVGIGTPPQYFDVILDTGSANFWINSKLCYDGSCKQQPAYDHDSSSTFDGIGLSLEVQFGSGTVEGVLNQDTVYLCGVTIPNQQIGEITGEEGDVFYDANFAGILGLAFPKLAAYNFDPVFDNVIEQGLLDQNIMTFYYSLSQDEQSIMTIGGIDRSLFRGDINWAPVIDGHEYYWLIKVDDIRLGEVSTGLCGLGCKAAVDTGTSLITAPQKDYKRLLSLLNLDCLDLDQMPDLVFVINGQDYSIPAREYMVTFTEDGEEENPGTHSAGAADCAISLAPMDVPPPE
jgi:cathepsin D